jgi:DNA repair exonuclease SbcCD ATPase subunit
MEFDELLITTGVDALVRLVKEKQRIELEDASSVLNIPQETIEDWARVLEEEGIIKLEYRLTRIYLVWVKPTEEEAAEEKHSFYEEKKTLEGEVEQFRQKVGEESSELRDLQGSFADFYAKAYAKIDALEKTVAPLPAAKTLSEDTFSKYQSELLSMDSRLQETRSGLDGIRKEIASLGIGQKSPSEEMIERIEKTRSEMAAMQDEVADLRRKAVQESSSEVSLPAVKDIKKKFEAMQKDFTALRSKNAQMRQDMISLHESSEILKTVAESIMGQEDKIGALRAELGGLTSEADRLLQKANEVSSAVKQNAELIDRLGDSVDVAKGVLRKFPSQEKVMEEVEKLKAEEDSLSEKNEALVKLLEAAGGRQMTAKQFTDTIEKMDERAGDIRKDMDALESALQDEKSTYLTFQKIKERIVPSIEAYQKALDDMEARIGSIRSESSSQVSSIMSEAQKLQESMKGGQMQGIVKVAEEIRDKKKMLDEIRSSLEELVSMSDNLGKRITLLSREAKLLEIRTSGPGGTAPAPSSGGGGGGMTEKAVRTQLELSREEELEFRRKREELKKLIQKLWEE